MYIKLSIPVNYIGDIMTCTLMNPIRFALFSGNDGRLVVFDRGRQGSQINNNNRAL